MQLVEEIGIPGNVEHPLKTVADVGRSLVWAMISQFFQTNCPNVIPLKSVDLAAWEDIGFTCEHQADIKSPPKPSPEINPKSKGL